MAELRGRKLNWKPRRDLDGFLMVTFSAAIASGAHQLGEEAEYFVYCVARALDVRGLINA